MSNIYSLDLLGFIPVGALPYGVDHEFWTEQPERKLFIDTIKQGVESGEYTLREMEGFRLTGLLSDEETGSFIFTANDDDADENCEDCPTLHHSVVYDNHEPHSVALTTDEAREELKKAHAERPSAIVRAI